MQYISNSRIILYLCSFRTNLERHHLIYHERDVLVALCSPCGPSTLCWQRKCPVRLALPPWRDRWNTSDLNYASLSFDGFLGEFFSFRIDHIDESCVCQILDVIHYCGAGRSVCRFASLADISALFGPSTGQQNIVKFSLSSKGISAQFCFDQQDIHFYPYVHCFQQILREITFFKEEG